MAKRIFLLAVVNILVVATVMFLLTLFNVQRYFPHGGLAGLAIMALIWGFGGAFISLALSRWMAKRFQGVQVISPNTGDPQFAGVLRTVHSLARQAGMTTMPEVGVYESQEVNAFATGPSQSRSLVAVSTGLLEAMPSSQAMAVLGHEITHIVNGDMVTMTLLQGVINAFVIFVAEILTIIIMQAMRSRDDEREGIGSFFLQNMIFNLVQIPVALLGMLVVNWFSRWREFGADAGGARLAGRDNMIHALQTLERITEPAAAGDAEAGVGAQNFRCLKISDARQTFMALFATHPPMEERIAALERLRVN